MPYKIQLVEISQESEYPDNTQTISSFKLSLEL